MLGQGSQNLEGTSRFSVEAHCDYLVLTQLHGKLAFSSMSFPHFHIIFTVYVWWKGNERNGAKWNDEDEYLYEWLLVILSFYFTSALQWHRELLLLFKDRKKYTQLFHFNNQRKYFVSCFPHCQYPPPAYEMQHVAVFTAALFTVGRTWKQPECPYVAKELYLMLCGDMNEKEIQKGGIICACFSIFQHIS